MAAAGARFDARLAEVRPEFAVSRNPLLAFPSTSSLATRSPDIVRLLAAREEERDLVRLLAEQPFDAPDPLVQESASRVTGEVEMSARSALFARLRAAGGELMTESDPAEIVRFLISNNADYGRFLQVTERAAQIYMPSLWRGVTRSEIQARLAATALLRARDREAGLSPMTQEEALQLAGDALAGMERTTRLRHAPLTRLAPWTPPPGPGRAAEMVRLIADRARRLAPSFTTAPSSSFSAFDAVAILRRGSSLSAQSLATTSFVSALLRSEGEAAAANLVDAYIRGAAGQPAHAWSIMETEQVIRLAADRIEQRALNALPLGVEMAFNPLQPRGPGGRWVRLTEFPMTTGQPGAPVGDLPPLVEQRLAQTPRNPTSLVVRRTTDFMPAIDAGLAGDERALAALAGQPPGSFLARASDADVVAGIGINPLSPEEALRRARMSLEAFPPGRQPRFHVATSAQAAQVRTIREQLIPLPVNSAAALEVLAAVRQSEEATLAAVTRGWPGATIVEYVRVPLSPERDFVVWHQGGTTYVAATGLETPQDFAAIGFNGASHFAENSAQVRAAIARIEGPAVLIGHSAGGEAVIVGAVERAGRGLGASTAVVTFAAPPPAITNAQRVLLGRLAVSTHYVVMGDPVPLALLPGTVQVPRIVLPMQSVRPSQNHFISSYQSALSAVGGLPPSLPPPPIGGGATPASGASGLVPRFLPLEPRGLGSSPRGFVPDAYYPPQAQQIRVALATPNPLPSSPLLVRLLESRVARVAGAVLEPLYVADLLRGSQSAVAGYNAAIGNSVLDNMRDIAILRGGPPLSPVERLERLARNPPSVFDLAWQGLRQEAFELLSPPSERVVRVSAGTPLGDLIINPVATLERRERERARGQAAINAAVPVGYGLLANPFGQLPLSRYPYQELGNAVGATLEFVSATPAARDLLGTLNVFSQGLAAANLREQVANLREQVESDLARVVDRQGSIEANAALGVNPLTPMPTIVARPQQRRAPRGNPLNIGQIGPFVPRPVPTVGPGNPFSRFR